VLVSLIALINTDNRPNLITRRPAGNDQPGQWADHRPAPRPGFLGIEVAI
jgi:hypothetical protein